MPRQLQPVVQFSDYLVGKSLNGQPDKPCLDIRCVAQWIGSEKDVPPFEVCRAGYKETYWTHRQLVAHQTHNGSRIGTGDLVGTGTMSMFEVMEMPKEETPSHDSNDCY